MYLIGDIGGTKTHLALVEENGKMAKDYKFPSKDYPHLLAIIEEFLQSSKDTIDKACFGIAGPVKNGRCQATNLPWVVDTKELSKSLNIPFVHLMNDLEANAWGINVLKDDQLCILNKGSEEGGNRCLISAGTGLGEAGIYYDGKGHLPFATEGGHTDFGPRNDIEIQLLQYLIQKYGHVSSERILSGPGLANVYCFLIEVKKEKKSFDYKEDELPKLVSEKGLSGECQTCKLALDLFVSLYGAAAGNLALKFLALGGVYVGGGIAPKILPRLKEGGFMESFIDKGRFSELLKSIPVRVILEENTALIGTRYYLSVV